MLLFLSFGTILVLTHFSLILTKNISEKDEYLTKITNNTLRSLTDKLLTECPNTNICGAYIPTKDINNRKCCIECSCEDDCRYKHSCCPHVLQTFTDTDIEDSSSGLSCRPAVILAHSRDIPKQDLGNEYYFIATCPRSSNSYLKDLCEREPREMFSLENARPLYDNETGRNYFNNHCATCNGVGKGNLIPWSVRISGPKQVVEGIWNLTNYLEDVLARNDCFIQFRPPTSVDVTPTLCNTVKVISKCNVTGSMTTYDQYLDEACTSYPLWYTIPTDASRRYKNVFCAICNGEVMNHTNCNTTPIEPQFNTISFIQPAVIRNDNCRVGDLYDPITTKCQKIHCTPPYIVAPFSKKCVRIYSPYTIQRSFSIDISLKVSPSSKFIFSDIPYYRGNIIRVLVKSLSLNICLIKILPKIDIPYGLIHTLSLDNPPLVTDIFITISIEIGSNLDPYNYEKKYDEIVTLLKTDIPVTPSHNQEPVVFTIKPKEVDPKYQGLHLSDGRFMPITVRKTLWNGAGTGYPEMLIAFEDPYDNMTVLQGIFLKLKNGVKCSNRSGDAHYDISLECATFMYDSDVTKFWRAPSGLVFDSNITVGFGDFRSLNKTHVFVCADSVRKLKTEVQISKGRFESYDNCWKTILSIGLMLGAGLSQTL